MKYEGMRECDISEIELAMSQLEMGEKTVALFPAVLANSLDTKITTYKSKKEGCMSGRLVCKIVGRTIDALKQGKLMQFDALVSECQCQLRAIMVAIIATEYFREGSPLPKKFEEVQRKITVIENALVKKFEEVENVSRTQLKYREQTLQQVLQEALQEDGNMQIPEELLPLVFSYMLTQTKLQKSSKQICTSCNEMVPSGKEETDFNKLQSLEKKAIQKVTCNIVEIAKNALSKMSCLSIQRLAQKCSSSLVQEMLGEENMQLSKIVEKKFSLPRVMLPCYYTIRAVYDAAIHLNIPIIIKSKMSQHMPEVFSDCFDTYMLIDQKKIYPLKEVDEKLKKLPALIIAGQRTGSQVKNEPQEMYEKRLLQTPFLDILEMEGAMHPQYIGNQMLDSVPLLKKNPEEMKRLLFLQERAKKEGCCYENQTLFCVNHIFCETIGSQYQEATKK